MPSNRELRVASVGEISPNPRTPLVRWTGDVYVPWSVTAHLLYGDTATIEVDIWMVERGTRAEPVVSNLKVTAHAPLGDRKASVTPADIRVPFERMIEAALAPLAHRRTTDENGRAVFERLVPESDYLTAPTIPPLPRRRRTRIDDALLEQVANAYNGALADPDETRGPAQVVAETVTHDGHAPSGGTVGRWIRAAKDAGLIPSERRP
jgi:hypothetical protein